MRPQIREDRLLGRVLLDRFRVDGFLAEGGMGAVYLGMQLRMKRPVAIKFLRTTGDLSRAEKRFQREAFVTSQLCHPNIVSVFDYGRTEEGALFIVMEYLRGELLGRKLLREGALSPRSAVRVGIQLARALRSIHAQGVVHRDLKPENVMIKMDGEGTEQVKVFDLGLVHPLEESPGLFVPFGRARLSSDGSLSGTPGYMAPEQAAGQQPDRRSDLYALGVVLYQMVTGKRPFQGTSILEILSKQNHSSYRAVNELAVDCPARLAAVIHKCMEMKIENRFSSADEVLESLEEPSRGPKLTRKRVAISLPIGREA